MVLYVELVSSYHVGQTKKTLTRGSSSGRLWSGCGQSKVLQRTEHSKKSDQCLGGGGEKNQNICASANQNMTSEFSYLEL